MQVSVNFTFPKNGALNYTAFFVSSKGGFSFNSFGFNSIRATFLNPGTVYSVAMVATNIKGSSDRTFPVSITTGVLL